MSQKLGPIDPSVVPSKAVQILLHGRHVRAARALLGWTQSELSIKSKVALGTIKRLEAEHGPVNAQSDTLRRLIDVFEKAGVEFLNEEAPGVRFRGKSPKVGRRIAS